MKQIDSLNEGMVTPNNIKKWLKEQQAKDRAAFADYIYALSEPIHVPGENDAYEEAMHQATGASDE